MKMRRIVSLSFVAAAGLLCQPSVWADGWIGPAFGDWNTGANWAAGVVPNNASAWAVAEVTNSTAVITSTVPNVSEAWAGNSGMPGNIIVTNGGTLTVDNWLVLGRTGAGGNTPLSTLTVSGNGIVRKRGGDAFIMGDGTSGRGQLTVRDNGQVLVTGGYNQVGIGWGSYGEGWLYLQDNALFDTPGYDLNVADWGDARGHVYIKDNARLNVSRLWLGKWDNTSGALWQSGGAVVGTGGNANEWCIGGEDNNNAFTTNSFGFYGLSGGTLTCPFNFQVGRWGKGVFYQSGGTNSQSGWCDTARNPLAIGIYWLSGGLFEHTGLTTRLFVGEQGRGELTMSGTGVLDTALNIVVGGAGSASGQLNLNGGTLRVPGFDRWGGFGYLNFNGGTLQPKLSNPNFMNASLSEARVYSGNAIVDTAGYDITVAQPLLDVTGQGVTRIAVSSGGAGYIAPPVVQIVGDGAGATAVAQIDPAAGTVTNILVTCTGHDYSSATATLIGGGSTTPATLGVAELAPVTGGGLVKKGAGTLTLSGANSYSGPTTVNQGVLMVTPLAFSAGAVTVVNGAGFGVLLPYASGQAYVPSLTMGTSSGTSLSFDLGAFGNPYSAPLAIIGNFAVNGTVTVNIADALPQVGQVPLVTYSTRSGSGSVTLGTLPSGVQATLVDDTANKLVYLNITGIGLPRWEGLAGGLWDINVTTNWIEQSTGLPTFYKDGAPVLFDDSALGTTNVNLVSTVSPVSVTVTNTTLDYTFFGAGKISGATSLVKQGSGNLTLVNSGANDYTGPTLITGGSIAVTNLANGGVASAIGKASSSPTNLVFSGGTLRYSGPATAIDRGYTVQGAIGGIDNASDLVLSGKTAAAYGGGFAKSGAGKLSYVGTGNNELSGGAFPGYNVLAGTLMLDGSAGAQVNHNQNEFWVGSSLDAGASLVLTNTTLNIDSWFALGRGNGTIGNTSTATLYDSNLRSGNASMGYANNVSGNLATQVMTLNGSSTFTNGGALNVSESAGSSASFYMNNSSILHNNGDFNIAGGAGSSASLYLNNNAKVYSGGRAFFGWHSGATGAVTIANSAAMYVNAWFSAGNEGGSGSVLLKDNAFLWVLWDLNLTDVNTGDATFTIQDNAVADANNFYLAKGVGSTAVAYQTGGTVHTRPNNSEFHVGGRGIGTYNMSGGVVNSDGNWTSVGRYTNSIGVLNVTGGTFNHNDVNKLLQVGEEGTGTINLSGTGAINAAGDRMQLASAAYSVGVFNLDGGVLTARRVGKGGGTGTFYFNGGRLRAAPNAHQDFMSGLTAAYVNTGGAVIDSGTNNIGILQPLLAGTGSGGLTKLGSGALALLGQNTYAGATLVNAGALAGTGVISGPVTVAASAALAPGVTIGTLSISNALTLAANSATMLDIDKTSGTCDLIQGLTSVTYGGMLVISNQSGALVVGDTFKVFSANSYSGSYAAVQAYSPGQAVTFDVSKLTVDGTIKVASVVSTVPATVGAVATGGNLHITWPADHIGWRLVGQTNTLSVGISNNWTTVPGSTTTNQVYIPLSPANPASFFRLVYP